MKTEKFPPLRWFNEEPIKRVLYESQFALFIADSKGHLVFYNREAEKLIGPHKSGMVGMPVSSFLFDANGQPFTFDFFSSEVTNNPKSVNRTIVSNDCH